MKICSRDRVAIPEGVTVTAKNRVVTVTGPRGKLVKDLRHLMLDFRVENKGTQFSVVRWFGNRLDISTIKTGLSHVRNMINGVTKGFRYKLRFAYAHFPINVSVEGKAVEIRNFLGEKRVRRLAVDEGVKVYRTDAAKVKDELVLEGNDIEVVSQTAARLHELCLVKNKDIRMFLDGIYVQTKEFVVSDE